MTKERKDFVLIKHKPAGPARVRIVSGPIDHTYVKDDEPHQVLRADWEGHFFKSARNYFELVEDPVQVKDRPRRHKDTKENDAHE